jgi:hypothetical protein
MSSGEPARPGAVARIARWDLDKTYLRTEFDTVKDLIKTALERPDEKRAHPGASAVMRELLAGGVEIHILSGSPEQMRGRLAQKLRLDGIRYASLTLKPNLQNLLKLRFRSLRGQLGYKLPALLRMRAQVESAAREVLVGDDAEADAFVYALYADLVAGRVHGDLVLAVMQADRCHPDEIAEAVHAVRRLEHAPVVDRILIHLDRQTPPSDFDPYGGRVVPFYNYFQAALVLAEQGLISAEGILRVGTDLVLQHRFDGDALVRSYLDLARRGHLRGDNLDALETALSKWPAAKRVSFEIPDSRRGSGGPSSSRVPLPGFDEIHALGGRLADLRAAIRAAPVREAERVPDYLSIVAGHNRRRR